MQPTIAEPISPELALVDPELAADARAALPAPGEFRPAWRTAPAPPATFAPPESTAAPGGFPAPSQMPWHGREPAIERSRPRRRMPIARFVITIALAAAVVGPPLAAEALRGTAGRPTLEVGLPASHGSAERTSAALVELPVEHVLRPASQHSPKLEAALETAAPHAPPSGRSVARQHAKAAAASPKRAATKVAAHSSRAAKQQRRAAQHTKSGRRAQRPRIERARPPAGLLEWAATRGASYYDVIVWRDGKRVLDLWPTRPQVALPHAWTYRGREYRLEAGRYLWFVYPHLGLRARGRFPQATEHGAVLVKRNQVVIERGNSK